MGQAVETHDGSKDEHDVRPRAARDTPGGDGRETKADGAQDDQAAAKICCANSAVKATKEVGSTRLYQLKQERSADTLLDIVKSKRHGNCPVPKAFGHVDEAMMGRA